MTARQQRVNQVIPAVEGAEKLGAEGGQELGDGHMGGVVAAHMGICVCMRQFRGSCWQFWRNMSMENDMIEVKVVGEISTDL